MYQESREDEAGGQTGTRKKRRAVARRARGSKGEQPVVPTLAFHAEPEGRNHHAQFFERKPDEGHVLRTVTVI